MASSSPSPAVERAKDHNYKLTSERVQAPTTTSIPYHTPNGSTPRHPTDLRSALSVQFHQNTPTQTKFSLIGADASLANALRRILLAEIPTLAIEDVFILQNTSVVHDEVLAQRLGLVPLRGSKRSLRLLRWRRRRRLAGPSEGMGDDVDEGPEEEGGEEDPATDLNTVKLGLHVKCSWKDGAQAKFFNEGETDPKVLYDNAHVYARDLTFEPIGQQKEWFEGEGAIQPVHPDILLDKLRPGHEVLLECHANFGIGADHAKFSPVATASYRLLPTIEILEPIRGAAARRFQRCFPEGVIGLWRRDRTVEAAHGAMEQEDVDEDEAVVKDTLRDTVTREALRHDEFKDKVKLGRARDHFIFSVESTGQWNGDELVEESIKVLREKCRRLRKCLAELREVG